MKRVGEVMTHHVVTVQPEATYKEIALVLDRNRVTGVPVVNDAGDILGVVSEGDLILKEELGAGGRCPGSRWHGRAYGETGTPWWLRRQKARGTVASELMTSPAITIGPGATTADAAKAMRESSVRRLLVVDAGGRLVGIVTRADLVRTFLRSDSRIRDDIAAALALSRRRVEPGQLSATVTGGVVTIEGHVELKSQIPPIIQAAGDVPGVVDVVSRIGFEVNDVPPELAAPSDETARFVDTWRSPVA